MHFQAEMMILNCGVCDVAFAITHSLVRNRKSMNEAFFCPNGHELHFHQPSPDEQKLAIIAGAWARIPTTEASCDK